MTYILKSAEEYAINRVLFNKEPILNKIQQNWISQSRIGRVAYLYDKLDAYGYEDFFRKYISDGEGNSFCQITLEGETERGRTLNQLWDMAKAFHEEVLSAKKSNLTIEDCMDNIISHAIIETVDGVELERSVVRLLSFNKGVTVRRADGDEDTKFNIDIVINNLSNGKTTYIQLKPISTFLANHPALIQDRARFFRRQEGIEVRYLIYDDVPKFGKSEIKFVRNINGKSYFYLNELCNIDGSLKGDISNNERFFLNINEKR